MSSPGVEALAGGIGSLIALLASYPLKTAYTLKAIRMQESSKGRRLTPQERSELMRHPAKLLRTLLGPLGVLYSGLKPAAIETAASQAIYFYFYSLLRAGVVSANRKRRGLPGVSAGSVAARSEDIGVPASLLVAAAAGAVNMVLTSPAQVVATQMQATATLKRQMASKGQACEHIRSDAWGVITHILQEDGLAGFWKGLAPNLILVVNPAVQYMAYEWLTQRHTALKRRRMGLPAAAAGSSSSRVKLAPGEVFLLGAAAKIAATVVTYPMIVIKSRLQATSSHTAAELQYNGTCDTIVRISREEGLGGFFKGMESKILQTALNAALMLMIKEQVHGSAAATMRGLEGLLHKTRAVAAQQGPGVHMLAVRAVT